MILVSGIRVGLREEEGSAVEQATARLGLQTHEVQAGHTVKVSIDARRREKIALVYTVGIVLEDADREAAVAEQAAGSDVRLDAPAAYRPNTGEAELEHRPVLVGFGPAGMFAGLLLAQAGYKPLILERGADVDTRVAAVEGFWSSGVLDSQTNVQFGEGGAGTFSDGKLTTRISDMRCGWVLQQLVRFGAPPEILYQAKPHIGTDRLRGIVKGIREEIIRLGGEIRFLSPVTAFEFVNGRVRGVTAGGVDIPTDVLILAIGHSARDTFSLLMEQQVEMAVKPFSVGVRIEQLQSDIDQGLFGAYAGHPALGHGEYQLSHRVNGRAVYTFCMCPGGVVVPSASEEGGVVVNGMSEFARDGRNANAALVVSVDSADFGDQPAAAIAFQRRLEQAAFAAGGGAYRAPSQTVGEYLYGKPRAGNVVEPSYRRGTTPTDLKQLFPEPISAMLRTGLLLFGQKLQGFAQNGAILTGVETRTSSPVRIVRGDEGESVSVAGLYPCGEGAGYAGGIMSAAVDGLHGAEHMMARYRPLEKI